MKVGAVELAGLLGLPQPTPEQVAVVEAELAPTLVVAGAGSGKTETMAARVVYLVANGLVRPDQVLGLTFTRKAAAGLGQRIRRRLARLAQSLGGRTEWQGAEPEVWTYHAFGGRIIAEFGPLAGVEPRARVLTPTAAWQLARRVVTRWDGDLDLDLRPEQVTDHVLALSGALADHLRSADELGDVVRALLDAIRRAPPGPRQSGELRSDLVPLLHRMTDRAAMLPLIAAFSAAKAENAVIDFADQMRIAANLVARSEQVGTALRDRHRVVLLDEYQDTGHAQRVILRTLFGGAPGSGHPVTAVGDPVQSIYSWRGASASNLPRFVQDFPRGDGRPAGMLTLSTSFRNAEAVLGVANAVSLPLRDEPVPVRPLSPRPDAPRGDVRIGLFPTVDAEDEWVATVLARAWAAAADAGLPPPSTAVLLRRRRDMDDMAAHLRAAGLPVEVVGLGGLLAEPEVADVVAVLRMLVDADAGDAAMRILTGARWRLGVADVAALHRRAQELAAGGRPVRQRRRITDQLSRVREALSEAAATEDVDRVSLIDALADPGPRHLYSPEGFARLRQLDGQLRRLRGRLGQPLPDLVAEVERITGLDIEVAVHSAAGRAHLDAFADVVADVAASGASLRELLEYLATAQEREDGLAPGEVEQRDDRVQVLTVHAAKGLEWQVVAVPHLVGSVFPSTQGRTWLSDSTQLPPSIRGDAADLPRFELPPSGADQRAVTAALDAHVDQLKAVTELEERRLLYVAVTRAEQLLLASGHHWGRTSSRALGPSEFLTEIRGNADDPGVEVVAWAPPPPVGDANPLTASPRQAEWPVDPLGDRRPALSRAAALVRAALDEDRRARPASASEEVHEDRPAGLRTPADDIDAGRRADLVASTDGEDGPDPDQTWSRDVDLLLAEREAERTARIEVPLPAQLSVTGLVDVATDPADVARRLHRPVPRGPSREASEGAAFHAWLERHFQGQALWDVAELPGAADAPQSVDSDRQEALRASFLRSAWANRVPVQVELPFSTTLGPLHLRGRIDAVFADADGGYTVVDWKTGPVPFGRPARAAAVQLAVYRLAAAELFGVDLAQVRAAFVHVGSGRTLAPVDLLDAKGLTDLVEAATTTGSGRVPDPGDRADDEHAWTVEGGPPAAGARSGDAPEDAQPATAVRPIGRPEDDGPSPARGGAGGEPDMARSSA